MSIEEEIIMLYEQMNDEQKSEATMLIRALAAKHSAECGSLPPSADR